ncbi:hypothetical protein [Alcanivorax sp. S71-1-4]|uniref:hypothetical protein n=1 Tax=Alcanivorax sp. S71-1-4 TaxID=1177159 RepID=UPI001358B8AE|nr:hypothetical protein [Alcanivorax sp. S71-1-4]
MKVIFKIILAVIILGAHNMSLASSQVRVSVDNGSPVFLDGNPISDSFAGMIEIVGGVTSINCNWQFDAEIVDDGISTTTLIITNSSVSGSFLCNLVSLGGYNWSGTADHTSLPTPFSPNIDVPFPVSIVTVQAPNCMASGALEFLYNNSISGFEIDDSIGACYIKAQVISVNHSYAILHY